METEANQAQQDYQQQQHVAHCLANDLSQAQERDHQAAQKNAGSRRGPSSMDAATVMLHDDVTQKAILDNC